MPPRDEVRAWLLKGQSDLSSARILASHDPPIFDTAAFHCQQAAEKALKAYLTFRGVRFERVHNLTYLLKLCEEQEPDFADLRPEAALLAPFAVEIRYPGDLTELTGDEAQAALAGAEAIWNRVLLALPQELRPSTFE